MGRAWWHHGGGGASGGRRWVGSSACGPRPKVILEDDLEDNVAGL
jgi:hypothetical protein